MLKLRRSRLSQNFLRSRILVRELVRKSSIGLQDLVFEIGPGEGIITRELLAVARHVIAVELDERFYRFLKQKFRSERNLTLYRGDALRVQLPRQPYKVFANIPFSIEGRLVRRFLHASNPPQDCYLVLRRSVAERLGGFYREGLFSILHKPFFTFDIVYSFRPSDFAPATLVQPVLLHITKRAIPLITPQEWEGYRRFVTQGFQEGRRLKQNLKAVMSPSALNRITQQLGVSASFMPSELTCEQWIGLFHAWSDKTS